MLVTRRSGKSGDALSETTRYPCFPNFMALSLAAASRSATASPDGSASLPPFELSAGRKTANRAGFLKSRYRHDQQQYQHCRHDQSHERSEAPGRRFGWFSRQGAGNGGLRGTVVHWVISCGAVWREMGSGEWGNMGENLGKGRPAFMLGRQLNCRPITGGRAAFQKHSHVAELLIALLQQLIDRLADQLAERRREDRASAGWPSGDGRGGRRRAARGSPRRSGPSG